MDKGRAMKTATDQAAVADEAIAAAEIMFADETGATLDLSPAAKAALILKIAAAIQAAVADEPSEAHMRAIILAFVCGLALAVTSVQAAPVPPNPPGSFIYFPNLEWTPLSNDAPSR
jgi:hypothetical protein